MNIRTLADQLVSQLESLPDAFISIGGASSGGEIAHDEIEITATFDAKGYLTAVTEQLQAEFAKHSLTQDQSIELATICFSKLLDLSDTEALELARESVTAG